MPDEQVGAVVDIPCDGTLGVRCTACGKAWLGQATFSDLVEITKLVDAHLSGHVPAR